MSRRFRRWKIKTEPEVVSRLLFLTREIAVEQQAQYQLELHELNMRVKRKLCELGVPAIYHHYYIHFAQDLWYLKKRFGQRGATPEADAVALYWWLRGLDPEVLIEVAKLLDFEVFTLFTEKLREAMQTALARTLTDVHTDPITVEYSYDPETGYLTETRITDKITGKTKVYRYYYDAQGNLIKVESEDK